MPQIPLDSFAFMNLPGGVEWVVILIVALLLFGRRLPDIMRGMGSSVREFKKGMEDGERPGSTASTPPAQPPPAGAVSRSQAKTEVYAPPVDDEPQKPAGS